MAELIPVEYQMRNVQKHHIAKWFVWGLIVVLVSGVSLVYAYIWAGQELKVHDSLQAKYQERSSLIIKSQELRVRRQELANRMQQVQQLIDDKTLLTLLRNISDGFGDADSLEFVNIDTHGKPREKGKAEPSPYTVRITGITANSSTLGHLMERLSLPSTTNMNVVLESSKRETAPEGQWMKFQLSCEKKTDKGT